MYNPLAHQLRLYCSLEEKNGGEQYSSRGFVSSPMLSRPANPHWWSSNE